MSALYSLLLCSVVICVQNKLMKKMDEHQVTEPLSLERQKMLLCTLYYTYIFLLW